jgi:ring-1,2-phenylacetyl-CoA epoxidase subunit PaaE
MFSSNTEMATLEVDPESAPVSGSHFYALKIRAVAQETRDAITIVFDVPAELKDKFQFTQGQYLTFRAQIEGQEVRRSYSICSGVHEGLLRVAIKRTPGGVFSNWIVKNAKRGCTLEVMPPEGRFHVQLSPEHTKNYVAFAVGSGITPILSIIKTTLLTEPGSTFTLFYGNRASGSVMFREELADLKDKFLERFALIHIMTREHQDIELLNGRIAGEKAEALIKQFCRFEIDTIFLCGPQEMVDDVSPRLRTLGVPDSRIKVELFTVSNSERRAARKISPAAPEAECEVTLVLDGVQHVFPMQKETESVLDAALRRGIDVRHSCKSGVCATCRAKLVQGKVDMDANYALEDYEIARGFILICQSYPVTDQITLDFDQDN